MFLQILSLRCSLKKVQSTGNLCIKFIPRQKSKVQRTVILNARFFEYSRNKPCSKKQYYFYNGCNVKVLRIIQQPKDTINLLMSFQFLFRKAGFYAPDIYWQFPKVAFSAPHPGHLLIRLPLKNYQF